MLSISNKCPGFSKAAWLSNCDVFDLNLTLETDGTNTGLAV
jgi:hypothetical protein